MRKLILLLCVFLITTIGKAQAPQDFTADYIKSAAFMDSSISVIPLFEFGTTFSFEFDDLYGNESDYYYRIKAYDYDWTPSKLKQIDYIKGLDQQRIKNTVNSVNTLQAYTHYQLNFPNEVYRITKSGNYLLEIYDADNEVIVRRKFVLYEKAVNVGIQIKRSRNLDFIDTKQNVEFTVSMGDGNFLNAANNVQVALFQNGRWDSQIRNIKPQYTIGTDLIYKYDSETQFWAGNQYLNFDNSDIRQVNNMIFSNNSSSGMYNTVLYPNESRKKRTYTYFPDINGAFRPRMINGRDVSSEGEYSWVYFTYRPVEEVSSNTMFFVTGMFNNYELNEQSKMTKNAQTGEYEKAILIKQGFTNYCYTAVVNGKVSGGDNPDGNFAMTTNKYQVVVYYRGSNDLYDRAIGMGTMGADTITY